VIQGNLDLLKRSRSEEDRQICLEAIESESKRMAKVANDLLLLAEIEAGEIQKKEEVSLGEIVREEIRRSQTLAGNRKVVAGRQEEVVVQGDAYKLRQLLSNLVDNAIKYTPEGGVIKVGTYRREGGPAWR